MYDKFLAQKIPLDQMKTGHSYAIVARNASFGIWDGEGFLVKRLKFRDTFIDTELHYDSDDHYGTAVPIELIEKVNFDLNLTQEMLNYFINLEKTHQATGG